MAKILKFDDEARRALDELAALNKKHADAHPQHEALAARMENYELAYRMQVEVPEVSDISNESEATKRLYGMESSRAETREYGAQCLIARRLVEQDVDVDDGNLGVVQQVFVLGQDFFLEDFIDTGEFVDVEARVAAGAQKRHDQRLDGRFL